MKALNVNKLTKSGVHFKFWVADWFAQLNNKMGGDLKKIQMIMNHLIFTIIIHNTMIFLLKIKLTLLKI